MKRRTGELVIVVLCVAVSGCVVAQGQAADPRLPLDQYPGTAARKPGESRNRRYLPPPRRLYASTRAPAPLAEEIPASPADDHVWLDGYWHWSGTRWLWVDGRWTENRAGYVYVEPYYGQRSTRDGSWAYVPAYWQPGDRLPTNVALTTEPKRAPTSPAVTLKRPRRGRQLAGRRQALRRPAQTPPRGQSFQPYAPRPVVTPSPAYRPPHVPVVVRTAPSAPTGTRSTQPTGTTRPSSVIIVSPRTPAAGRGAAPRGRPPTGATVPGLSGPTRAVIVSPGGSRPPTALPRGAGRPTGAARGRRLPNSARQVRGGATRSVRMPAGRRR